MRVTDDPAHPEYEWLEQLFDEHYEELCSFVHGYVFSSEAAEDLVQDLFVSIWQNPERWTVAGDALRPLLFVAARNRALDLLRHQRVRERYAERVIAEGVESTAPPADYALFQQLIQQDVADAIATLPGRAREIFVLSREEGLTYREIAARLNLSVKTVETQMSRSLKRLRDVLAVYLALVLVLLHS